MEIQQHDGMVVEVAGSRQGFAKRKRGGEVLRREREAPRARVPLPSLPPLYIGPLGGSPALGDGISKGGSGQGGNLPPKPDGGAPTLGVPTLGAGGPRGGAPAHQGLVPLPLQPMGPSGIGGPTQWTPGTLPVVPVQYR